jgi:hypothetical protein
MDKITELKKTSFLSKTATYQQRQETRRRNEEYLHSQSEAQPSTGSSFLDTGAHKVLTPEGKRIFDTLVMLKRKEESQIRVRPKQWHTISFQVNLGDGIEKEKITENNDPLAMRGYTGGRSRFFLTDDMKRELKLAFSGGTQSRVPQGSKDNGDDESDDDDMFDVNNEKKKQTPSIGAIARGEGRLTALNRIREELNQDYEEGEKEKEHLKNELKHLRDLSKAENEEGEHYMECFPEYGEDDYQASIKDTLGLKKRPPMRGGRGGFHSKFPKPSSGI